MIGGSNYTEEYDPTQPNSSVDTQRKLYFINEQLQEMARALPLKYQQRLPNELLVALAQSLLEPSVFQIVQKLMDIQHVTEKQLSNERLQLTIKQSLEIQDMLIAHSDEAVVLANKQMLGVKHMKELKEMDKYIIRQLDERVHEQQKYLDKAGVPGFEMTDDPIKIQVQIRILDFILRLSQMDAPL